MEERHVPGADQEVRIHRELGVRDGEVADVGGDVCVGIVQDQPFDARALEGDGRRQVVQFVQGEEAGLGLPGGVGVGAGDS